LAFLLGALIVVPSTTASAANCGSPIPSNVSSGYGYPTAGTHNLYNGPYTACTRLQAVHAGDKLFFWCSYKNSYGNKWIYVRKEGTNSAGWISAANIGTTVGSLNACP
jgi:hypothetical protein